MGLQLKNVLFLFAFNVHLEEFTSMLWVIILHEYKSLTHKLRSRWDHVMLQYAVKPVRFNLSFTWYKSPNLQMAKAPTHHNRPSSMLHGWCDTEGFSSFTNSSLHVDPPYLTHRFWTRFVSPKDSIPLLYWSVFKRLGPLEHFDMVLLPQQWFLDSNSTILASVTESSPHSGCWHIFSRHWFSCAVMFEQLTFYYASWWLW